MSLSTQWRVRGDAIPPLHHDTMDRAQRRLDDLTKPRGSLGHLEPLVIRLAGITGNVIPHIEKPWAIIFAADHGVAEEGVSAYDQAVTEEMAVNAAMGSALCSVLARSHHCDLWIVDVGIARLARHPVIIERKVGWGTHNIAHGPAMTESELNQAIETGWILAGDAIDKGCDCLIIGEMGIGNTTAAAAMAAALLSADVDDVVGPGTGLTPHQRARKVAIVSQALTANHPDRDNPWDVLRKLGGFEIAAMTGAILAAATRRVPILLDGMPTGMAALVAVGLAPMTQGYLIAGHVSPEPAHARIIEAMKLTPLLNLGLRVGEASGALMALPLITQALKAMAEMATFSDARVTNPHGDSGSQDLTISPNDRNPVSFAFSPAEQQAVYKVIQARRDIRVFLPDPIAETTLARILAAGHMGPSVGFMQPWNFILIRDRATREQLQRLVERERVAAGKHYPDRQRDYYLRLKVEGLVDAPLTLCVTNDRTRGGPHVLGRNTIPETDLMSTACAIENMWLAARAEGVAVGWVSMYQKNDVRDVLGIPTHVDPVALLSMGFTSHFPEIPVLERVGWGKRLELESLVFVERWGQTANTANREGFE